MKKLHGRKQTGLQKLVAVSNCLAGITKAELRKVEWNDMKISRYKGQLLAYAGLWWETARQIFTIQNIRHSMWGLSNKHQNTEEAAFLSEKEKLLSEVVHALKALPLGTTDQQLEKLDHLISVLNSYLTKAERVQLIQQLTFHTSVIDLKKLFTRRMLKRSLRALIGRTTKKRAYRGLRKYHYLYYRSHFRHVVDETGDAFQIVPNNVKSFSNLSQLKNHGHLPDHPGTDRLTGNQQYTYG
ncbi:hypothetical protein [Chitinophaga sp. 22620]|uniref:hypothetical protein n=1 Tax=Chitinophaga sp. 22620 TaxID=3453952 RepID=UPI003F85C440